MLASGGALTVTRKLSWNLLLALVGASAVVSAATPEQLEFFEREIRPVLAERCYSCHSSDAQAVFANLRLDSRAAVLAGSDAGPVVTAGDSAGSKLMKALRGEITQMPPSGRLPDDSIAAIARWIDMGLPWPEESAPELPSPAATFDLADRREQHWAWRPIRDTQPPKTSNESWPLSPVDRFVLAKIEAEGLTAAGDATREVFIRRATFDLIGLPPTPEEIDVFVADREPGAHDRLVDRLLRSPRFGEHWARRWMDLMRYSESHGSEGDPDIPEAWRYRDYLIRAFNADLPYDQIIREHLAGDLLVQPRVDLELGINESLLGSAHWRLVEHGFDPVDPWEDRVRWTDNQIDVLSKTFLGLTVSCARCHDHKFDAISQKDYYALFGSIKGARPTQRAIDTPDILLQNHDELASLKSEIRDQLVSSWLGSIEDGDVVRQAGNDAWEPESPLHALALLGSLEGEEFSQGWKTLADYWRLEIDSREAFNRSGFDPQWDLRREEDYRKWIRHGTGLGEKPSRPGEFEIPPAGPSVISGIYGGGVRTNLLTRKHSAVLQSPSFEIDSDYISFRVGGGNFSFVRLILENYPVPRGGIYSLRHSPKTDDPVWVTWKTDYWKGFSAYIEYATLDDVTHFQLDPIDQRRKPRPQPTRDGRSWFSAERVVFHNQEDTPRDEIEPIALLLEAAAPGSARELRQRIETLLVDTIHAWRDGRLTESQAAYLDSFVSNGVLETEAANLPTVKPLVERYRELEDEIPIPRRAPGVIEEGGDAQRLLIRGSHKNPGDMVERRGLTALGGELFDDGPAARLGLARMVTSVDNPLTPRVIVNRLWASLFGRGLVATVDNFGKLGDAPSHPELLDWLAVRLVEDDWSLKKTLRRLATSRAYRMSSDVAVEALEADPDNRLLSHMPVRRLRAEQIRDALLAVSGRLDYEMYGPSVPVYYAYATGKTKGDQAKGPVDGKGRRSLYQEIRRNTHNPFLEVFDLPKPATTRGTRDVTNVPGQSLTMLNSPFVIGQAEVWAKALVEDGSETPADRFERMFVTALGRKPTASERDRALTYMAELDAARGVADAERMSEPASWQDLAQALFNLKEFIYVR